MDSITHLALGAVIGDATGGKKLGKKAMALGAAVQFLPDFDFIAAFWLSPAENLVAHRGITHSIFFNILATWVLALAARSTFTKKSQPLKFWMLFFGIQASAHIFIDTFNAYGVGLLEPFSTVRFSFHSVYVFDPLFSLWIFMAAIVLITRKVSSPVGVRWALFALSASATYLVVSLAIKTWIHGEIKDSLRYKQIEYDAFIATPTPFNVLLWYIVVRTDGGYHIGYRSVFDGTPAIEFNYFPRNDQLVKTKLPHIHKKLVSLSQGYYRYASEDDTVSISLLVFGQIAGWKDRDAPFVLKCDLIPPETTLALLQEGRAEEMNKESLSALVNRIFNEKSDD